MIQQTCEKENEALKIKKRNSTDRKRILRSLLNGTKRQGS